ncbi:hypothetical protein CffCFBP3418_15580 [Curtobacterium flaccumfaciens pv. flaccumfaciens]|nr:hypothetical protein CffCFBP3418_15580 [Curtobacterium flaccumfaciens pv. flaccumfaciens]
MPGHATCPAARDSVRRAAATADSVRRAAATADSVGRGRTRATSNAPTGPVGALLVVVPISG